MEAKVILAVLVLLVLLLVVRVVIVTSYWRTHSGKRLKSHSDDQNPHPENVSCERLGLKTQEEVE